MLDHTLSDGRYGSQPEMKWLCSAMTAGAVGSLACFYVIVPLRQRSAKWRVTVIRPLTPKQWELTLAPDNRTEPGIALIAGGLGIAPLWRLRRST